MATKQTETDGTTLSFRVHGDELAALDALAQDLSESARGARVSRSDAARVALLQGIESIKAEKKTKR